MVGSKLNLKLLRDLHFSPMMFGGVVLLLAAGIALFGASYELFLNLGSSYRLSYDRLHLADFSVSVQSAPEEILQTLRRIPGVSQVEGRVVDEVEIDQPEADSEKVVGRIISLPDTGSPKLNQLKIIAGGYPGPGSSQELVLEASFARYHNYQPGDYLRIVILGEKVRFRITGITQSPEYIYLVRGAEYPMPSPRTFGVMWIRKSTVDGLVGTGGAVNDIQIEMASRARRNSAMRATTRILRPYGADEPIRQEKQPGVELLQLDLLGLQRLAFFFPVLFLTISSFSVYNLLSRMVYAQRGQIGFLRAAGFSKTAIGLHYLQFSVLVGSVGAGIGSISGHFLSIWITRLYTIYLQVPYFDVTPKWSVVGVGFISAASITILAGLLPSLTAAALPPARAIAVEVPPTGRAPLIEKILPFLSRLSMLSRLPLRNFMRSWRRSLATIAGVASAAILLLVSSGLLDSTAATINFYFQKSTHYNIEATYLHPQSESVLEQIEHWKGVKLIEPGLAVPARLVNNGKDQTILLYGLYPAGRLYSLFDVDGKPIPPEKHGIMIADSTARKLGLKLNNRVLLTLPKKTIPEIPVELPQLQDRARFLLMQTLTGQSYKKRIFSSSRALLETRLEKSVLVTGVTYQPAGNSAFASIGEVRMWYGNTLELPSKAINAALIDADPEYQKEIERKLYKLDGISSVVVTRYIEEEIYEMLKTSNIFFNVMLGFSVALAAIIVFNSTLLNVIERTREIAALRTVGLSTRAIARMIITENLLAYIIGILLGVPFGTWLSGKFVDMYTSDTFSMQSVIYPQTYWITVSGIFLSVLVAQLPGIFYIRKIELTKATKDIG